MNRCLWGTRCSESGRASSSRNLASRPSNLRGQRPGIFYVKFPAKADKLAEALKALLELKGVRVIRLNSWNSA